MSKPNATKDKDLHELVGLARLLVQQGIITEHQAVEAMNISLRHFDRNGWPEEEVANEA